MKNKLKTITILALVGAFAPSRSVRAAYEDVGVSARVTGMGNAFTAVADDVYSIYYNPAGLGTLDRAEFATSYSKLYAGLSDNSNLQNSFLAYSHPIADGRLGSYGLAWNYFTLDSLYRETQLFGSYGRPLFSDSARDTYYGGVNFKILNRSLGGVDAAGAPLNNTGQVVPGNDPVLQGTSKTNLDFDLGFLYRPEPRWSVGLMIQHLLEPNIAFSSGDSDKLGRNVKLGGAYKTPFSTLSTDLDFRAAPDGSLDKILSVGAEKWLPTLVHGTFGIRGSLGVGSRDFRQLAMGVSYRIYRMQFDYGFAIPLGGISGTAGTHRLGITVRFGRPRQAELRFADSILENMQELARVGTPEYRYQMENLALYKRTTMEDLLHQAKLDTASGRFTSALDKVSQALSLSPGDRVIQSSQQRLKVVGAYYPEIGQFRTDPAQAIVYEGIMEFLSGNDQEAIIKISYALSLNPADPKLSGLLRDIEASPVLPQAAPTAPLPSWLTMPAQPRPPAPPPIPLPPAPAPAAATPEVVVSTPAAPAAATVAAPEAGVGGDMALLEVALREREYDKVIALARKVIERDPSNSLAYMRMGTAYYNQKNYPEALTALRSAYKLESDPMLRKSLQSYIKALSPAGGPKPKAAAAPKAEGAPEALGPQEIERLYESGVDLYAQGKFAEAAKLFKRILAADPKNISARRALERVEAEMKQGGGK